MLFCWCHNSILANAVDKQDTHSVLSAAFHPSGDFVMAGTEHNMVRLMMIDVAIRMLSAPTLFVNQ
eukprot:COSAG05_NODE_43_length_25931_cov_49.314636_21_plen_66_part_00